MQEACDNLWQAYGCEWNIEYLWHWLSRIGRIDVFALALMLAYTFVVAGCVFYRCQLARRTEPSDAADPEFRRSRRKLVVDLNIWIASLKSIGLAAPFLGLVGTCEGILNALSRGIAMEKGAALALISTEIAATLITTAAGTLVAIPATGFHNYLRTQVDLLEWGISAKPASSVFQVAQTLPLRKRISGLPTYGLMAAPCFAVAAWAFMVAFASHRTPMGLSVEVINSLEPAMTEHFAKDPIFVAIENPRGKAPSTLYLNSEKTAWDGLDAALRAARVVRSESVAYVEAESHVPWADVINAIDVAEHICDRVILLTVVPNFESSHRREKNRRVTQHSPRNSPR